MITRVGAFLVALMLASNSFAQTAFITGTNGGPGNSFAPKVYQATFFASGSGTIPSNATYCTFVAEGGAQSGAGGGTIATSGSGGASGGTGAKVYSGPISVAEILLKYGGLDYTVTIGAGGAQAAAGAVANLGGDTFFTIHGSGTDQWLAPGAGGAAATAGQSLGTSTGGQGGRNTYVTSTPSAGGASTQTVFLGAIAISGAGSSALGSGTTTNARNGPGPGGPGGGLNAGTASAGSAGGNSQGYIFGGGGNGGATPGGTGQPGASNLFFPLGPDGGGGGGGGGNGAGAGGPGGAGGQPAGSGGGGGSGTTGGGTGGKGGDGAAYIACS